MPKFLVVRKYKADRVGPWQPGDLVNLDPDVAAWVNCDSPGVLFPADDASPLALASAKALELMEENDRADQTTDEKPAKNRLQTKGRKRPAKAVDDAPPADIDDSGQADQAAAEADATADDPAIDESDQADEKPAKRRKRPADKAVDGGDPEITAKTFKAVKDKD